MPLHLDEGERVEVELVLWPEGVIAGTVVDSAGEPEAGVLVSAFRQSLDGLGGLRRSGRTETDDRGIYRLSGLVSGDYLVALAENPPLAWSGMPPGSPDDRAVWPTVFYPNARSASAAEVIEVSPGETRYGVDFMRRPLPGHALAGRVIGLPEDVPANVLLLPGEAAGFRGDLELAAVRAGPGGRFSFDEVPRGDYVIRVVAAPRPVGGPPFSGPVQDPQGLLMGFSPSPPEPVPIAPMTSEPTWWAEARVSVTEDIDDLPVVVNVGARIRGRVVHQGLSGPPPPDQLVRTPILVLSLNGARWGWFPVAGIGPGGRFETAGLPPGDYAIFPFPLTTTPFWSVRSLSGADVRPGTGIIRLGATDAEDLVITLTDRAAQVTGTVRDGEGRPVAGCSVFAFPEDRSVWEVLVHAYPNASRTKSDRHGRFVVDGLVPGRYRVAATTEAPRACRDPAFLTTLVPNAVAATADDEAPPDVSLEIRGLAGERTVAGSTVRWCQ
jgi:protocatechuate 3,4-dioxygenase beta subunit